MERKSLSRDRLKDSASVGNEFVIRGGEKRFCKRGNYENGKSEWRHLLSTKVYLSCDVSTGSFARKRQRRGSRGDYVTSSILARATIQIEEQRRFHAPTFCRNQAVAGTTLPPPSMVATEAAINNLLDHPSL